MKIINLISLELLHTAYSILDFKSLSHRNSFIYISVVCCHEDIEETGSELFPDPATVDGVPGE